MSDYIFIVEQAQDWPDNKVVLAKDYLSEPQRFRGRGIRIINLCRSYRYLSEGYYCSLLAEARRHRIIPDVRTLTDLSRKSVYSLNFDDFQQRLLRLSRLHPEAVSGDSMELLICFGRCIDPNLQDFARQIFEQFPCPLLKVGFRFKGQWQIQFIRTVTLQSLSSEQRLEFTEGLQQYLSKRHRNLRQKSNARYDMAILYNPEEKLPPSNMAALKKMIQIGRQCGLAVELIQQKDYNRLGEYDALFIRETTAIEHYTYRFAKRAEAEGIVVMDDPDSIVKCTNKVYLTELLTTNKIAIPESIILRKGDKLKSVERLGYPIVLKIPNGSFSRGIYKAENYQQVSVYAQMLFKESDLILAQEYLYTDFDWRIGILNNKPVFACQYFMSKSHWQIVKHDDKGGAREGGYQAWAIEQVPHTVIDLATRAANLIGSGFYGVDIKQTAERTVVMEVNDNPNLEAGVEDTVLGNELYHIIIREFLRRLERRTTNSTNEVAA